MNLKGNGGSGWNVTVLAGNQVVGEYRNGFGRDCPLEFKTDGTVDVLENSDFVFYSSIKGAGGFTKTGGGNLEFFTLTEANSYYGTTYIKDGGVWLVNGAGLGEQGVLSISGPLVIGSTNENESPMVFLHRSNGAIFQITYYGGDGNDVALIQKSLAFVSQITTGQKLPNGTFALKGVGATGLTYKVDATTNLNEPILWTWIGTVVSDASGQIQFADVNAPQHPMRFYRLRYP